ncbi:NADH dehydrogenase i, l subunit [Luminiphilus syltensis NOR5-1B]|uniref:NADH dehydrogenase i, l subunit n=1 Tax=Luminiphilus syltensis NOR5-1B TaxID=565045 RepID=B8KTH0_9GAMM|nr:NADH-quinone oxidoreductase subunit L [Luminiphilus syltensis]EED34504.1 NADH dehydrogenase i, l subunit [Luminiphilus syltensis NOR5-1B]
MNLALAAIPGLPMLSATLLILFGRQIPRSLGAVLGAGSVGLSAVLVAGQLLAYLDTPTVVTATLWTWMSVADFSAAIAFHIDGLTVVMMSVITGVGFLIHVYSVEFMWEDESFSRYFAYMNLFVGSMLLLVMADNLLLLFLGWEGVGMCSYLLVGFWYKNPANGAAARKAFVVTRVGDALMALGLFVLFTDLGTLDIQPLLLAANLNWEVGGTVPVLATALLLGGAVGKSAQLPLHTWLPDAMAGPTPVSALIHAATMVTAGVYLVARLHGLFLLAPATLTAVAWVGLATLLLAASAALVQQDIKRILAYSTISQIGYMFLALGVGAFSFGIFHLMTHAFFKALLFLGAGAVSHCLHHELNIFRMGGLRTRLPVVFLSFLIGSAALAALPFTAGFYSKDGILLSAFTAPGIGPWLWAGGLLGALLTSIYSFRLLFVAFFGEAQTEPDRKPGLPMAIPLLILCALSLLGGLISQPLDGVLPDAGHPQVPHLIEWISIGVPLLGVAYAYYAYIVRRPSSSPAEAGGDSPVEGFLFAGWRVDALYNLLLVTPYRTLARWCQGEPIDHFYNGVVSLNRLCHRGLAALQTGELRWYATTFVIGLIAVVAIVLRSAP